VIPLQLRLENFMCYRQADLDFRDIRLACLSGENGSGKSALLDSITWALWGKARARRDDDLIRLGETEMAVELVFALGEARYRVIRRRSSQGRGQSVLELQGWDPQAGVYRPLTEPTIRKTQARINSLLRMDYETFINSAFLLQGRADEFTIKPPGERKRILGEILGLGLYDEYEERAKERAKAKAAEAEQLAAQVREMERELARRPEYEEELQRAQAEVERLSAELQEADQALQTLYEERRDLEARRTQMEELALRLREGKHELSDLEAQLALVRQRLAEHEAIIARRAAIEEGYRALVAARQEEARLYQKQQQAGALAARLAELEKALSEARHTLELDRQGVLARIEELERKAAGLPEKEQALHELQAQIVHLKELEQRNAAIVQELQDITAEVAALRTRNEQLKEEMVPLKERVDQLQAAQANCPLCGQPLPDEERLHLIDELVAQGKAKGDAWRANKARIEELLAQEKSLREEQAVIAEALRAGEAVRRREATLAQEVATAQQAIAALEEERRRLAALEARLQQEDYAPQVRQELAQVRESLAALDFDPAAYEQVRRDVMTLAPFERQQQELEAALREVEEERAGVARLEATIARKRESLTADQSRYEELSVQVARLAQIQAQIADQEPRVADLRVRERQARDVLAAVRQKLDYCAYLEREREKRLAEEKKAREEQSIYEELRAAFGRRGLQAMIIEHAIPEIEDEANRLLSRMTDGRMHIRLETQRETRKGDPVETLDIHISDEQGTRSYELYSGGEKFRVNFAIRIALSRLLARRAGAQLSTLVIDEGFGTQDAQGRARLVEAINSISDDFQLILVITHIEELRDAFPLRIEVTKTPQGSQVAII